MKKWDEYYKNTINKKQSSLLERFISLNIQKNDAIDLGCGAGNDTVFLIKNGYTVLAIDREESVKDIILHKLEQKEYDKIKFEINDFENIQLPNTDLVNASYSLPFCRPQYFNEFWNNICNAINKEGFFVGNFLGVEDEWKDRQNMTFITKHELDIMFKKFEVIYFNEIKEIRKTASGRNKFWNIYEIIAQKVVE